MRGSMHEWRIENTDQYERDYKNYEKKHKEELKAILNNLDSYYRALKECGSPILVKAGFVHNEPMGIKALDQKCGGIKGKLKATRLYIYPNIEENILMLLAIGDKQAQGRDVEQCKKRVKALRGRQ